MSERHPTNPAETHDNSHEKRDNLELVDRLTGLSQSYLVAQAGLNGGSEDRYSQKYERAVHEDAIKGQGDYEAYANLNTLVNLVRDGRKEDLNNDEKEFLAAVEANIKASQASIQLSPQEIVAINTLSRGDTMSILNSLSGELYECGRQAKTSTERYELSKDRRTLDDFIVDFAGFQQSGFLPDADDLAPANARVRPYLNPNLSQDDMTEFHEVGANESVAIQIQRNTLYAKYAARIAKEAVTRASSESKGTVL